MIPKIIHYCWFGDNEKSIQVQEYIKVWKEKLPDYEFMEWNELSFNIQKNKFVKEAYEEKKYAFVSDVARLDALYSFGGIYMDTDVILKRRPDSVIKSTDSLVLGFENGGCQISTAFIASEKSNEHIGKLLTDYDAKSFMIVNEGKVQYDSTPNTYLFAEYFSNLGLKLDNTYQEIQNARIYPEDYFSAYDFRFFEITETNNTVCIHNFNGSWSTKNKKIKKKVKKILINIFGVDNYKKFYFLVKGKS
ncbi:hypothetical protein BG261_06770 [Floricoccus tropicus]|uniref:Glycosyl transferase n=1 Tax=Floricoccus tropicus TaxID=1859473 RepID=A0A1E8GLS5_9LACT|nr:glycosyltransferase [Floricoccus tropicus]OFI48593.1 hypothetical protein BG261_06770 [Floricoccus tropicus]